MQKRTQLMQTLGDRDCAFVYHLEAVRHSARALRELASVARVHYSMKANPHPEILQAVRGEGVELECVSRGEVERALQLFRTSTGRAFSTHLTSLRAPNTSGHSSRGYALPSTTRM